jgi:hypothetical protein
MPEKKRRKKKTGGKEILGRGNKTKSDSTGSHQKNSSYKKAKRPFCVSPL